MRSFLQPSILRRREYCQRPKQHVFGKSSGGELLGICCQNSGTFSEFPIKLAPRNDSALCAKRKRFTVYNRAIRTCSPTRGIPPQSISRRSRKTSQRLMQCSASARGSHGSSSCCQHGRPSPSSSPSILETIFSLQSGQRLITLFQHTIDFDSFWGPAHSQ